jgi:hypothetical protein
MEPPVDRGAPSVFQRFMLDLATKYPAFAPGKMGNHPQAVKVLLSMGMPFMAKRISVYCIEPEAVISNGAGIYT